VRVLRPARPAPQLGLVHGRRRSGCVPGLRHDVDPSNEHQFVIVATAVLAGAGHGSTLYTDDTAGSRVALDGEEGDMPATTTPVTVPDIRARKGGRPAGPGGETQPLVMVTAYDAPGARIADEA